MQDKIFEAFLTRQYEEGMGLAADSDIVELIAEGTRPPQRYLVRFHCRGLVRGADDGAIHEASLFLAGVCFPPDYLRRTDPRLILTWLGPSNVWHPNISDRGPSICIGRLEPGTRLKDILHRLYEVIAYQRYTPNEWDSLNKAACSWARNHPERFPVDARPLKRRQLNLEVETS